MWYRSSDGTTYVYYVDADTSQWVEIRSEIATSKVGLVPLIPASVSVDSGTASVAADGLITVSGAGSLRVNGIFSSAYNNYRIVHQSSGANANTGINFRMRASGTDYSGANQTQGILYWGNPGAVTNLGGTTYTSLQLGWIEGAAGNRNVLTADIFNPYNTVHTSYISFANSYVVSTTGGYIPTTSSYDGINMFVSGTYSGSVKFYGYN
jgi:hypothetical protein